MFLSELPGKPCAKSSVRAAAGAVADRRATRSPTLSQSLGTAYVAPLRGLVQVTRLTLEGCPGLTGDKRELTESVEAKRKAFAALSNREASFASRGSRVSWD